MRRGLGLNRMSKKRKDIIRDYDAAVTRVFLRAGGRCEVEIDGARCILKAKDSHHVVKRSQGGALCDPDNIMAVCRGHHDRADAAYSRGRLVITPLGGGRFACEIVKKADKFT